MNSDLGQQWAMPTAALSFEADGTPEKQTVIVEVLDIEGTSYGEFEVELDPSKVEQDCSSAGTWASPADSSGAHVKAHICRCRCSAADLPAGFPCNSHNSYTLLVL